jgi:hypothetical protein
MDINPPTDWITSTFTRHKTYKDCGFEGAFTPRENSPDETETDVGKTRLSSSGPNDIDIEMTSDMKAIKGTAVQKWGSGGDAYDINIEVNYEYS